MFEKILVTMPARSNYLISQRGSKKPKLSTSDHLRFRFGKIITLANPFYYDIVVNLLYFNAIS